MHPQENCNSIYFLDPAKKDLGVETGNNSKQVFLVCGFPGAMLTMMQ
jgi:hypothetical protein